MPTIKQRTTMTANGVASPLVGSQFEYLPWAAKVEFAVLGDTGANVRATIYSGTDVLMEDAQIDIKAVAEAIRYPDDFTVIDVAAAGERISVQLREAAGGTPVVRTEVRVTPIG